MFARSRRVGKLASSLLGATYWVTEPFPFSFFSCGDICIQFFKGHQNILGDFSSCCFPSPLINVKGIVKSSESQRQQSQDQSRIKLMWCSIRICIKELWCDWKTWEIFSSGRNVSIEWLSEHSLQISWQKKHSRVKNHKELRRRIDILRPLKWFLSWVMELEEQLKHKKTNTQRECSRKLHSLTLL